MRLIYVAHRAPQYDSRTGAVNWSPGATIVRESRAQISTLLGFLTVACVAALARGVPGAQTTAGASMTGPSGADACPTAVG